jgi:hypothetical protein
MKIFSKVLLISSVVGLVSLSSCYKCTQCQYTTSRTGVDSIHLLPSKCGNGREIRAYENESKAESARYSAVEESFKCDKK